MTNTADGGVGLFISENNGTSFHRIDDVAFRGVGGFPTGMDFTNPSRLVVSNFHGGYFMSDLVFQTSSQGNVSETTDVSGMNQGAIFEWFR